MTFAQNIPNLQKNITLMLLADRGWEESHENLCTYCISNMKTSKPSDETLGFLISFRFDPN